MGSSLHLSQGQMAHRTLRGHTPPTAPPSETSLSPRHNGFSRPSSDPKDQKPRVPLPPKLRPSAQAFTSMAWNPRTSWEGEGTTVPTSQMGVPRATGEGDLLWTPPLQQSWPGPGGQCGGASHQPSPSDHSSTSLPDGPLHPTRRDPHPSAVPSHPEEKHVTVLQPGTEALPETPLYLPSHRTPTSDPDSPPNSSPFGALCPCYFLTPYHLSLYLSA